MKVSFRMLMLWLMPQSAYFKLSTDESLDLILMNNSFQVGDKLVIWKTNIGPTLLYLKSEKIMAERFSKLSKLFVLTLFSFQQALHLLHLKQQNSRQPWRVRMHSYTSIGNCTHLPHLLKAPDLMKLVVKRENILQQDRPDIVRW